MSETNSPKSALNSQVAGDHYKIFGNMQPWEVMGRWFTPQELLGAVKFAVIGYLARPKNVREDLEKARHILELYLEISKREGKDGVVAQELRDALLQCMRPAAEPVAPVTPNTPESKPFVWNLLDSRRNHRVVAAKLLGYEAWSRVIPGQYLTESYLNKYRDRGPGPAVYIPGRDAKQVAVALLFADQPVYWTTAKGVEYLSSDSYSKILSKLYNSEERKEMLGIQQPVRLLKSAEIYTVLAYTTSEGGTWKRPSRALKVPWHQLNELVGLGSKTTIQLTDALGIPHTIKAHSLLLAEYPYRWDVNHGATPQTSTFVAETFAANEWV